MRLPNRCFQSLKVYNEKVWVSYILGYRVTAEGSFDHIVHCTNVLVGTSLKLSFCLAVDRVKPPPPHLLRSATPLVFVFTVP